jgi:hypothetical protein
MSGKTMLAAIEANGGRAGLIAEHQALAGQHGDDYLPLLERFYRSSRASLIRLASVLKLAERTHMCKPYAFTYAVTWPVYQLWPGYARRPARG